MELGACSIDCLLVVKQLKLLDDVSGLCLAIKRDNSKLRRPTCKFTNPVSDGRVRNDHESWPSLEIGRKLSNEGRYLDGFALEHVRYMNITARII